MPNEISPADTPNDPPQADGPAAPAAPAEPALEEQLLKTQADAQKYLDNWRRAEADFQNYKRRAEQERDDLRRFAGVALISNLLPIVDDLERAFGSLDGGLAGLTWLDGLRLIYRKLVMLLENAGVKPIEASGLPFDPRYHEAVAHIDGEDGKVLSEVQRGYMLHDRVLRPAMVVVGKGTGEEGSVKKEEGGNA
jgi:molecular chaperone GrpE